MHSWTDIFSSFQWQSNASSTSWPIINLYIKLIYSSLNRSYLHIDNVFVVTRCWLYLLNLKEILLRDKKTLQWGIIG